MYYVLWNVDQRAYVARPGQKRSFTRKLHQAQPFDTREAATASMCPDNEKVTAVVGL